MSVMSKEPVEISQNYGSTIGEISSDSPVDFYGTAFYFYPSGYKNAVYIGQPGNVGEVLTDKTPIFTIKKYSQVYSCKPNSLITVKFNTKNPQGYVPIAITSWNTGSTNVYVDTLNTSSMVLQNCKTIEVKNAKAEITVLYVLNGIMQ